MAITSRSDKQIVALGLTEEQAFRDIDPGLLLSISDVSPNDYNPKTCNDERLVALAASIKQTGWVPSELPLVWEDPHGVTRYTIINGEHRWHICRIAGFARYPAVIANAVKSREDALALTMALEEARARRDGAKYTRNLIELATRGRDDLLRNVLRQRDPDELRRLAAERADKAKSVQAKAKEQRAAPRIVSLTFTSKQFDEYKTALGAARTRLKQAQETIDMVSDLSDADVVAIAAVLRNGRSTNEMHA